MQLDLRDLESGRTFEADICIVGAGAAGITIARELINSPLKVLLLESGGVDWEEDIQALYEGQITGDDYLPLDACRLRYFGGTSNHWSGMSFPLQAIDFEQRAWIPHSGWPITRADLLPYYERAQNVCELGPFLYDRRAVAGAGADPDAIDESRIISHYYRFSTPTRFGEVYGPELAKAENITVMLHATVARLVAPEGGRTVSHAELHDTSGKTGTVRARYFILACGGLENPRTLLLSDAASPNGLGNGNDLVGRYFMENPEPVVADIAAHDPLDMARRYSRGSFNGYRLLHSWALTADTQADRQLLNAAATIETGHSTVDGAEYRQSAFFNFRELLRDVSAGKWPTKLKMKAWRVARDLDGVAVGAFERVRTGDWPVPASLGVVIRIEPEPLPDSRVLLADERDALGQRRMRLEWRRGERGPLTIRALCEIMGTEIGRLGLGRLQMQPWLLEETAWPERTIVGNHHMGTTRMSADPKQGVVDANCRSHEVDNLFVAGSSVFPTCGYNNPTLTLVALAVRLSDHIKGLDA